MKLYIPEIGDHIVLTKDWTFELHSETRNAQLGALFGYYLCGGWIEEEKLPQLRNPDYDIKYPSREDPKFRKMFGGIDFSAYNAACKEAEDSCPEYIKYADDRAEWLEKAKMLEKNQISITIPAGTTLAIDRIYIRKGASDFSSITFYAKNLGEVTMPGSRWSWGNPKSKKIKAQRFWAKLSDCNNIEFEMVEK